MKTDTNPNTLDPDLRAAPLPEHRPAKPKVLPAKRSFRLLVGFMALVPLAVAAAAIAMTLL
tara:strand:- start:126 stop:308 length:183 start_codon:yes stop_codon:yes gene_type:complete